MHLYVLTRGIKDKIEKWANDLSAQYLPFQLKGNDVKGAKPGTYHFPVTLRPVQMWDICFPREHKDLILASVMGGGDGKPINKKHNKFGNNPAVIRHPRRGRDPDPL